jgi:tetratricopeptide (TPR) repeat protein
MASTPAVYFIAAGEVAQLARHEADACGQRAGAILERRTEFDAAQVAQLEAFLNALTAALTVTKLLDSRVDMAPGDQLVLEFLDTQRRLRDTLPPRLLRTCQTCHAQTLVNPEYETRIAKARKQQKMARGVGDAAMVLAGGVMPLVRRGAGLLSNDPGVPAFVCGTCKGLDAEDVDVWLCSNCHRPCQGVVISRCSACGYDLREVVDREPLWKPASMFRLPPPNLPPDTSFAIPLAHPEIVTSVALPETTSSPVLVTGCADGVARRWTPAGELPTGNLEHRQAGDKWGAWSVRLSGQTRWLAVAVTHDGRRVATAGPNGLAQLWELASGERLADFRHADTAVTDVAVDAKGRRVVTGCNNKLAFVWDTSPPRLSRALPHDAAILSVAVSADAGGVVVGCGKPDRAAHLWDATSGARVADLPHGSEVLSVAFSPDGRWVATGGADGRACLWRLADGRLLTVLQHAASVSAVAFSRDGRFMVTASADTTARMWELPTGRELARAHHGSAVRAVALSPDSRALATGAGRDARLWDLTGLPLPLVAAGDATRALSETQADPAGASIDRDHTVDSDPTELPAMAAFNLGVRLAEHGDFAGATSAYRRAIDSGQPDAAAMAAVNLGRLLEAQGDAAGAIAAYGSAVDSAHVDGAAEAAFSLGVVLAGQGDAAGASAAYRRAIHSGHVEVSPAAALSLGRLLQGQGDVAGARAAYQRALDSGHRECAPIAATDLRVLLEGEGGMAGAQLASGDAPSTWAPAWQAGSQLRGLLGGDGDRLGAAKVYRRAVESHHPEHARRALADLARRVGNRPGGAGSRSQGD